MSIFSLDSESERYRKITERFLEGAKEQYIDQLESGLRDICLMPWWKRWLFAHHRAVKALGFVPRK